MGRFGHSLPAAIFQKIYKEFNNLINVLQRVGARMIPVAPNSKNPIRKNWSENAENAEWFKANPDHNIGVVLGEASGGLVDIDLDDTIAKALAHLFLPPTAMIFGRRSSPSSHYIYRIQGQPGKTEKFQFGNLGMLCEYRSEGSQTVFPPSTHPTGEKIEFECDGDPLVISRAELIGAVSKLAAATLIAHSWVDGNRHQLALAISGSLSRAGWEPFEVSKFIDAICLVANDSERIDRVRAVKDTIDKHAEGRSVTGWPSVAEYIGEEKASRIAAWLGVEFDNQRLVGIEPSLFDLMGGETASYTDLGNARRFCEQNGDHCFFHSGFGKWFVWDGRRWSPSTAGAIEKLGHQVALGLFADAAGSKEALRWAEQSCSATRVDAMLKMAQPYLSKCVEDLDRAPLLFNCLNGTVDLRTGQLRPHSRADMLTQLADVAFNPEAEAPRFNQFVNEIFDSNHEQAEFAQKAFGYALTGETKEQVMFVLHGTGANGKGTLVELIASIMGEYSKTAQADSLMQKARASGGEATPDLARLVGARLVSLSEGDRKHRLNEALVKQLTGEDTVTARPLYKESFEFKPKAKLFLSTNYLPKISGSDHGIWRRILPIPFTKTFDEDRRDRHLRSKLEQEKSGVLNWLISGCLQWQKEGLNPPAAVLDAKADYRAASDHILQFLDDRTETALNATVTKAVLYEGYRSWCITNGERYVSNREFGEAVGKRPGVVSGRTKQAHQWSGLKFVSDDRPVSELERMSVSSSW